MARADTNKNQRVAHELIVLKKTRNATGSFREIKKF